MKREMLSKMSSAPSNILQLMENLADSYGDLYVAVKQLQERPEFKEFERVKKELMECLDNYVIDDPTIVIVVAGDRWQLEFSECVKNPRKLKEDAMPKLKKLLGEDVLLKIVHVTMKDLDQYLGKTVIEPLLEEPSYSKNRKITISPRQGKE